MSANVISLPQKKLEQRRDSVKELSSELSRIVAMIDNYCDGLRNKNYDDPDLLLEILNRLDAVTEQLERG